MILERFSHAAAALAVSVMPLVMGPSLCVAQAPGERVAVAVSEENFRAAPNGIRLAVLEEGTVLTGGGSRDRWRQATLDAWVPASGVSTSAQDGFDLAIVSGGAVLHAAPDGASIGRGLGGMMLDEVSREGSWINVRRTGWIWSASIGPPPAPAAVAPEAARPAEQPASEAAAVATPSPAQARGEVVIHAAPAGTPLGTLGSETQLDVVGREGDWARVRLEGWVLSPAGGAINTPAPLSNVTLDAMRQEPERYRGQTITWSVQFVALQTADSLRTDMSPGERYMLARDPGGDPGFVYISLPDALLANVRRLIPLQRIEITARVRTGRSEQMGHPVLELIEIR